MSDSALVSIITVNYFSEEDIKACYASIREKNTVPVEFILVSNSPLTDAFKQWLSQTNLPVHIHETGENLGFAKACNIGAQLATGEFLFFLNPDTRFLNDVLTHLLHCQKAFPQAAILGPKTFNGKHKPAPTVKNFLSGWYFILFMVPLLRFFGFFGSSFFLGGHKLCTDTKPVPVLNGHALFIKKTVFKKIGEMENRFFMFWEENDLCLKAHQHGYKVLFCAEAELIHLEGTSTSPFFIKMEIEKHRSQKTFVQLHHPKWILLNRISGIFGYLWRALLSILSFNKKKIAQHWTLFLWYSFRYK